ncbi:MAG: hypothetical protein ACLFUO_02595 [Candidatus Woesearchaeota archaeon]
MEIKFEKNSAEFEMDFNFYDYPSIIEAAKEFTESCYVAIKGADDGNSLFIRIEPKKSSDEVRDAVFSFFNYTLGIMTRKIKNQMTDEEACE